MQNMRMNWLTHALKSGMLLTVLSLRGVADQDQWQQAIDRAEKLQDQGKLAEARSALAEALEAAAGHPKREFRLAYTLNDLGSVAQDQGQFYDAEKYYRQSLTHWRNRGGASQEGTARTLNNLASLMHAAG